MNIIDLAIKNRTAVIVLAVALSIGGLYSYITLPKESQPQIEFATIIVTTIYPGASPDDVESIITQEVEREVATLSGLDNLRSTSTEGVSTVIAEFLPDKDIDEAGREVREAVDLAKGEFPSDVEEPFVNDIDFADFPVLTVNLLTEGSLTELRRTAESLQDELEAVPGVNTVDLIGGLEREVQVNVDLMALQGYNLSIGKIVEAIQFENTNIPGGSVDVGPENYLLRVNGEFEKPEEILDIVIDAPGGQPIYVRDVADVEFGYKDRSSYARLEVVQSQLADGAYEPVDNVENLQVIRLNVSKQTGKNIIEVVAAVEEVINDFRFPDNTTFVLTGDQSESVELLVKDLENNIIAGILFVIAVLLFFLGVRNATLVGLAIPLSMFLSFLIFSVMGQTLNFIILFSLIIALGMLVDNAVVIVENIYRYREEGYGRWEAALEGTKEVGLAVATSTLTTVAAFAPMLLWPGIIGKFMSYMPLTLIVTLSSSLFVALFINPVITGYLMRTGDEDVKPVSQRRKQISYALVAFTALVVGLTRWQTLVFLVVAVPTLWALYKYILEPAHERFSNRSFPKMVTSYRTFLGWMLQRDYAVNRAMLRNTFALGSFTVGFLLLVVGGILSTFSPIGAMLLLVPGGIALAVGALGFIAHSIETAFLGGRASVKVGLYFGGVVLVLIALLLISGKLVLDSAVGLEVILGMLLIPIVLVFWGFLGTLFGPSAKQAKGRPARVTANGVPYLILTDNRARLLTSTFGLLFAVIGLFFIAPTGVEFFPTSDPQQVQITAEAPTGTTIERSNEIAEEVFTRVQGLMGDGTATKANVKNVATSVGVGGDQQFGGGAASAERSNVTLNLMDYSDRAEPSTETLDRIRGSLKGIPGVDIQVTQNQDGPPTGAAVNIEISGKNFDTLVDIAGDLKTKINDAVDAGRIDGLVDVRDNLNTGRPEYRIQIDRERAATFGLSTQKVALAVRGAVNGTEASKWRDGKDEYDITVRLGENDRENLRQIESLTVFDEGIQIPLTAVATIVPASGLGSVTRLDQQRVVTVQADAAPGANANAVLDLVKAELESTVEALPADYTIAYTGASEEQNESFSFLTTALLIGISLITIILIAQFNSVKNPFIIMVAVGLSLLGVLLGLILTRTPFGLMTFIGVISLAGIVVNNAIVLVDFIEQLRSRGENKQEAIIDGGATRLRPVLLTAFTTVIGLIPLTFGINIDFVGLIVDLSPSFSFGSENTQFWGPMGTAIISGLTFATFLTLVIVPVMYSAFDSLATRMSGASVKDQASELATNGVGGSDGLQPVAVAT